MSDRASEDRGRGGWNRHSGKENSISKGTESVRLKLGVQQGHSVLRPDQGQGRKGKRGVRQGQRRGGKEDIAVPAALRPCRYLFTVVSRPALSPSSTSPYKPSSATASSGSSPSPSDRQSLGPFLLVLPSFIKHLLNAWVLHWLPF